MIKNRKDALTIAEGLADITLAKSNPGWEITKKYVEYIGKDQVSKLEESSLREYEELLIRADDRKVINALQCVVALRTCKEYMFKHFVKKCTNIAKSAGAVQAEIGEQYNKIRS